MKAKIILVIFNFLLVRSIGLGQAIDSIQIISKRKVSFVTIFDKNNATKDGYYVNGYVVNIDYETGQNLHMKKVKISGKVTIVKGIKPYQSGETIAQGRYEDTKHILKPTIKILI